MTLFFFFNFEKSRFKENVFMTAEKEIDLFLKRRIQVDFILFHFCLSFVCLSQILQSVFDPLPTVRFSLNVAYKFNFDNNTVWGAFSEPYTTLSVAKSRSKKTALRTGGKYLGKKIRVMLATLLIIINRKHDYNKEYNFALY